MKFRFEIVARAFVLEKIVLISNLKCDKFFKNLKHAL